MIMKQSFVFLCWLQTSLSLWKSQEQFSWNILDYQYPNDWDKFKALQSGEFIPENSLPVGIEVWKDKLFITVPRWKPGVPSTLNYIPIDSQHKSPILRPYPNWDWNTLTGTGCETTLTTVYRIHADKCNRLWVFDAGTLGIGANSTQRRCPFSLNIFDLETDQIIRKYVLKPDDVNGNTFIANIVVDLGETCDDAYAYLSDELGYGLVVYSFKDNESWRFEHQYFMPDPLEGGFIIDGLQFEWGQEGIFGMSLSPSDKNGYKTLYFGPLSSTLEFTISTQILQNRTRAGKLLISDFHVLEDRGFFGHITAQIMDPDGLQLFNLIDHNAIGCWNSKNDIYTPENMDILEEDYEAMIFPSDIKIDAYDNVWVMSDRMSNFLLADLDYKDVNFRVLWAPKQILLQDSVCQTYLV